MKKGLNIQMLVQNCISFMGNAYCYLPNNY